MCDWLDEWIGEKFIDSTRLASLPTNLLSASGPDSLFAAVLLGLAEAVVVMMAEAVQTVVAILMKVSWWYLRWWQR